MAHAFLPPPESSAPEFSASSPQPTLLELSNIDAHDLCQAPAAAVSMVDTDDRRLKEALAKCEEWRSRCLEAETRLHLVSATQTMARAQKHAQVDQDCSSVGTPGVGQLEDAPTYDIQRRLSMQLRESFLTWMVASLRRKLADLRCATCGTARVPQLERLSSSNGAMFSSPLRRRTTDGWREGACGGERDETGEEGEAGAGAGKEEGVGTREVFGLVEAEWGETGEGKGAGAAEDGGLHVPRPGTHPADSRSSDLRPLADATISSLAISLEPVAVDDPHCTSPTADAPLASSTAPLNVPPPSSRPEESVPYCEPQAASASWSGAVSGAIQVFEHTIQKHHVAAAFEKLKT